jgi:hypothetical protein
MRRLVPAVLLAALLAACAGPPERSGSDGTFVSMVGTPFLIALKIPACILTVAIAGPLAGASALAGPSPNIAAGDLRRGLDEGLTRNCGPPYVVRPESTAPEPPAR